MADVPAAETDVVAIGNAIVGLPSHAGEADAGGFLYAPTRMRRPAAASLPLAGASPAPRGLRSSAISAPGRRSGWRIR
jgi:hypothetical protein